MMTPIEANEIEDIDGSMFHVNLEPVIETVSRVAAELGPETTLIGFCGAPWTVATYMIAGHGTPEQAPARLFAYRQPEAFEGLLNLLADHSADYLGWQIEAGAEVVQIFDSWSGVLDEPCFERFCVKPVARMVARLRGKHPNAKVIGFPKGAGAFYTTYREKTGVDAVGLDWTVPLSAAVELQNKGAVQGNLDPLRVVAGGAALDEGVDAILEMLGSGPLIFNLGHGITPDAPVTHVEQLVRLVRGIGEG